jgi:HAD superfamily hydrolase (TIGR01509 family)
MLLDLPRERLEILQALRKNYTVALFSNTNAIHLEEVYKIALRDTGFATFENHFDKEYYSHTFHQRKPDTEAFLALLEENGWLAEETLFLDDTMD